MIDELYEKYCREVYPTLDEQKQDEAEMTLEELEARRDELAEQIDQNFCVTNDERKPYGQAI
jgi:hypothetical protein